MANNGIFQQFAPGGMGEGEEGEEGECFDQQRFFVCCALCCDSSRCPSASVVTHWAPLPAQGMSS